MNRRNISGLGTLVLVSLLAGFLVISTQTKGTLDTSTKKAVTDAVSPKQTPPPTPAKSKMLTNDYQVFQSFNNCGPASLSMALSYFGIRKTQEELGHELRPYQNPEGNNDDKSVTLKELGLKAEEYGLLSYHRPSGDLNKIKAFISLGLPVITRTWLKPDEDIGHFRVVKGYDDTTQEIIQDDSYQGHNIHYSYEIFNSMWEKFNYEYLVLVPKDRQQEVKAILGTEANEKVAWEKAIAHAQKMLSKNPDDVYALFNLSVAYDNVGDYTSAVKTFEKVENRLPARTLWYQIEPIEAYFELKNDTRVFELTDAIFNNNNRAFSELYILRGKIYQRNSDQERAREEFEKAVYYNESLTEAKKLLTQVTDAHE